MCWWWGREVGGKTSGRGERREGDGEGEREKEFRV
jgi:hypothetical protein